MNSIYVGIAAFVYIGAIAIALRLFKFSDHDDNMNDEGGWK